MHPRLAELARYVDDRRAELESAAGRLPYARWSERPADDAWSVAQVFDHLHLSEASIAKLLAKRIARAREAGALYQWVLFVGQHEARHTRQVEQIVRQLG
jgi:hypothetical protein